MQPARITTPDPTLESMRREAVSHAERIAALVRERFGAAPILDREAHRRQTARRLTAGATLSGS